MGRKKLVGLERHGRHPVGLDISRSTSGQAVPPRAVRGKIAGSLLCWPDRQSGDWMPDVFINFRTGDEESAATLIERDLSSRFGSEKIFRDSKSIKAGEEFPQRLLSAVHGSRAMLAVIGPRWLVARGPDGRNALDNEQDWIRRELLAAKEYGVRVIPVLVGDHTIRLDSATLPPALSWLADVQYRRFRNRDADADLATIAADLVAFVPGLTDRTTAGARESGRSEINTTARDVRGDIITITDTSGPVHVGRGSQFNGPTNYFAGREDRP